MKTFEMLAFAFQGSLRIMGPRLYAPAMMMTVPTLGTIVYFVVGSTIVSACAIARHSHLGALRHIQWGHTTADVMYFSVGSSKQSYQFALIAATNGVYTCVGLSRRASMWIAQAPASLRERCTRSALQRVISRAPSVAMKATVVSALFAVGAATRGAKAGVRAVDGASAIAQRTAVTTVARLSAGSSALRIHSQRTGYISVGLMTKSSYASVKVLCAAASSARLIPTRARKGIRIGAACASAAYMGAIGATGRIGSRVTATTTQAAAFAAHVAIGSVLVNESRASHTTALVVRSGVGLAKRGVERVCMIAGRARAIVGHRNVSRWAAASRKFMQKAGTVVRYAPIGLASTSLSHGVRKVRFASSAARESRIVKRLQRNLNANVEGSSSRGGNTTRRVASAVSAIQSTTTNRFNRVLSHQAKRKLERHSDGDSAHTPQVSMMTAVQESVASYGGRVMCYAPIGIARRCTAQCLRATHNTAAAVKAYTSAALLVVDPHGVNLS